MRTVNTARNVPSTNTYTGCLKPGDRVQTPTYSDDWMRGDRYGSVVKIYQSRAWGSWKARVLLDKSGKTRTFLVETLHPV